MTTKSKRTRGEAVVSTFQWESETEVLVQERQGWGAGMCVATYSGPGHRAAARRHAAVIRKALRFDGRNER